MARNSSGETSHWFRLIALLPLATFGLLLLSTVPGHGASPVAVEASLASRGIRMAFVIYGTCLIVGYGLLLLHEWRERLSVVRQGGGCE